MRLVLFEHASVVGCVMWGHLISCVRVGASRSVGGLGVDVCAHAKNLYASEIAASMIINNNWWLLTFLYL